MKLAPINFVRPPLVVYMAVQQSVAVLVPNGFTNGMSNRGGHCRAACQVNNVQGEALAAIGINTVGN